MQANTITVKLNVGGKRYETSLATLKRDPHSFFAKLVRNGDFSSKEFFIDRNGQYFEYILDYLRQPATWEPPIDKETRTILRREADFYSLPGLVQILEQKYNLAKRYGSYNSFLVVKFPDKTYSLHASTMIKDDFGLKDQEGKDILELAGNIRKYMNKYYEIGYEFVQAIRYHNVTIYIFKVR